MTRPVYPENLDFLIASFAAVNPDFPDASDVISESGGELTEFYGLDGLVVPGTTGTTVTYSFATPENSGLSNINADPTLFREIVENLRDIIRATLDEVSQYIDISFVEIASGETQEGNRHLEISGIGSAGGQFVPNTDPESGSPLGTGGFILMGIANVASDNFQSLLLADDQQFDDGTFPLFKAIFIHELGHSLGLGHPVSDNVVVSPDIQPLVRLPDEFNTTQYTIMGGPTRLGSSTPPELQRLVDEGTTFFVTSDTFGLLDILALQRLYGPNTKDTQGNNTYAFKADQALFQVVYDAGGVDTFDFQNQLSAIVADIREGAFSSAGLLETKSGADAGAAPPVVQISNNIAVAFETIIENVVGSDFDDNIRGNVGSNRLEGMSGADTIDGAEGNDRLLGGDDDDKLMGGDGADTLVGGAGADKAEGGAGHDRFFAGSDDAGDDIYAGGAGNDLLAVGVGDDLAIGDSAVSIGLNDTTTGADGSDTIFGGDGNDTLLGGSWDDTDNNSRFDSGEQLQVGSSSNVLYGGSGADVVFGDGGADTLGGGLGSDTLIGGAGNDLFYGGKGATDADDVFSGGLGNDIFFGGSGDDIVSANEGEDELFGGAGRDTLNGGAGADSLFGGAGDDTLAGGSGTDSFFFANNHGDDVVSDFSVSEDILFLANTVTDFTDLASVQAASSETTVGGQSGLLIDTGGGNSVFLVGINLAGLTADNLSI